jgi:hypothetical protein
VTPDDQIEKLWEMQRAAQKWVQDIADQMAAIPRARINISQQQWDLLIAAWNRANEEMQAIGRQLSKMYSP